MIITNTTLNDLPFIYRLFEEAINYQKANGYIGWKEYDKNYIQSDVVKGLSFKIVEQGMITGIFSICQSDPLIWRDKEKGDAIYLHRIVANRQVKAEPVFTKVLAWARQFAKQHALNYIRMDTWAENEKIIAYYQSHGFDFVEDYTTPDTLHLPAQHRNLHVALLEMRVEE